MSKRKRRTGGSTRNPNSLANLRRGGNPAPKGNQRHRTHGGYAPVAVDRLREKEREVFAAIGEDLPLREADGSPPAADALAVSLLAETLCRVDSVRGYLDRRGFEDADGELRPAVALEARLRSDALAVAKELGLTPRSRMALGLDLVRVEGVAEDAAEQRRARELLDRRLEALDGAQAVDDHRDAEGDSESAEDIAAPHEHDNREDDPNRPDANVDPGSSGGHDPRSVPGSRASE
jgi:hypothetical protein